MSNTVHIRWMIRRDMVEVLDIEQEAFGEWAWTEEEFIKCLRQRNNIGMVAELNDRVVAYMIYGIDKTKLELFTIAVHGSFRRRGVGARLIAKLTGKLRVGGRTRIMTAVRESNLDAHLFLKGLGFKAVAVLHNYYEKHDHEEDAYTFQYRYRVPVEKTEGAGA